MIVMNALSELNHKVTVYVIMQYGSWLATAGVCT